MERPSASTRTDVYSDQSSRSGTRLYAELDTVLLGRLPTVAHLVVLPYTRMVIQETMRLYPPVFGFTPHATASDEIGGYPILANSVLFVSPYCTHRHPAFWEEPEVFDPERFTPERSVDRPHFAYFPFGEGPRQCIGNAFAMMEAQLILSGRDLISTEWRTLCV